MNNPNKTKQNKKHQCSSRKNTSGVGGGELMDLFSAKRALVLVKLVFIDSLLK